MSTTTLLTSFVERLGWTLFHSLWQFSLIAAVAWCLLRIVKPRSARLRYGIECAALSAMVVAAGATFCVVSSLPASTQELTPVVASVDLESVEHQVVGSVESSSDEAVAIGEGQWLHDGFDRRPIVPNAEGAQLQSPVTAAKPTVRERVAAKWKATAFVVAPWLPTIIVAWLLGVCALAIRPLVGWHSVRRLRTNGVSDVPKHVVEIVEGISCRIGVSRAVRVVESSLVEVPTVIGWMRPLILLPASALIGLSTQQLEAVIAHEVAHIRRYDYVVNALQVLAETVFFYHPAVWWISHCMRIDREQCCDEIAVGFTGDRTAYAKLLLWLEEARNAASPPAPVLSSAGGSLRDRVRHVVSPRSDRRSNGGPAVLAMLLTIVLAAGGFWMVAEAGDPPEQDKENSVVDGSEGNIADPVGSEPKEPQSIGDIAKRIALTMPPSGEWKVVEVDKNAHRVGPHTGHRIMLERSRKEFTDIEQRLQAFSPDNSNRPFRIVKEQQEFALFPIGPGVEKPPASLKSQIRWQPGNRYLLSTKDVWMGEGLGHAWFSRISIQTQDNIRQKLKLIGGEDRIALLVGATVYKQGSLTGDGIQMGDAYVAQHELGRIGDPAIPVILAAIKKARSDDNVWYAIGSLGFMRTDRSTRVLEQFFRSSNKSHRSAAARALIHEPFRESAKATYLEILKSRLYVSYVCKACVQFGWTEAVPILKQLTDKPSILRELSDTVRARRTLEGRPIAKNLLDAAETLKARRTSQFDAQSAQALHVLTSSVDDEAATLLAIELATVTNKGDMTAVNEAGHLILEARPLTVRNLQRLINSLPAAERSRVEKLLAEVADEGRDDDEAGWDPAPAGPTPNPNPVFTIGPLSPAFPGGPPGFDPAFPSSPLYSPPHEVPSAGAAFESIPDGPHVATIFGAMVFLEQIEPKNTAKLSPAKIMELRVRRLRDKIVRRAVDDFARREKLTIPNEWKKSLWESVQRKDPSPMSGFTKEQTLRTHYAWQFGSMHDWLIARSLYKRYGGRIGYGSMGLWLAIDGRNALVREYLDNRRIEVHDAELREAIRKEFDKSNQSRGGIDVFLRDDQIKERLAVPPHLWGRPAGGSAKAKVAPELPVVGKYPRQIRNPGNSVDPESREISNSSGH